MSAVKSQRSWGLTLFGLPFFCVGAGFLLLSVIPTLHDAWRMASWLETPGTLLQAQLVAGRSDDATTYRVTAQYRYNIAGRDYRNDRVAISDSADNVGDFQQTLGNRLEQALYSGQPVSVWYDPGNPQDAVLSRDPRWGLLGFKLIFVIAFGGAGFGMMYFGLFGRKSIAAAQPWLQRPEWQGGVIGSGAKTGMYFAWGFTLIWNLVSVPAAFLIPGVWRENGEIALLILIFPLVGAGLLIWAIKTLLEWKRFGATPLTMDPFPGAIGGDVGGEILVNLRYDPAAQYEVTLSCINSYISGTGEDRSRSEKIVWQDSGYAEAQPALHGVRLQFRFEVPDGLPTSEDHSNNYHLWRLTVHGDLPGVDLNRSFELPVYRNAEKSRHIKTFSPQYRPAGMPQIEVAALLPLTQSGQRIDIYYPMLRKPLSALAMLLFGSVFCGISLFLWHQAKSEGFPLYIMSIIFGFAGGLIVLGGFYALFNSLHVYCDGRSVSTVRRVLGIPINSKSLAHPLIRSIEIKQSGSSQSGNTHHINYQVLAKTASGDMVLAEGLDAHSKAKMVQEYYEKLLGVGA